MRRGVSCLMAVVLAVAGLQAQRNGRGAEAARPLEIYVVDVEGGKATLFVAPSGETVLIDTGSPGGRDVSRIMDVLQAAGVTKISYLISTHYHVDHVGGLQELVTKVPVEHFVDHGPTVEGPVNPELREQVAGFQAAYAELYGKARHTVVKPGDRLSIAGLDWRIVTSAGQVMKAALPGAGKKNDACALSAPKPNTADPENAQSVGSLVTFGQFRTIDLGDLLWDNELALMCPNNPIGTVDLYLVSHHGTAPSGSEALVYGLAPRVAVMQNGVTKGAAVPVMQVLRGSPRLTDIWLSHWSYTAGIEHNPPGIFIANLEDPATLGARLSAPPPQPGGPRGAGGGGRGAAQPPHTPAYWIKISAMQDGSFTVTNTRNNFSKSYAK